MPKPCFDPTLLFNCSPPLLKYSNSLTLFWNFDSEGEFVANSNGFYFSCLGVQNSDPWWRRLRCWCDADHFWIPVKKIAIFFFCLYNLLGFIYCVFCGKNIYLFFFFFCMYLCYVLMNKKCWAFYDISV